MNVMRWWAALLCAAAWGCSGGGPSAPDDSSFAGVWAGTYAVRGCTTVGWPSCEGLELQVGGVYPISMTLTQNGNAVSGQAQVTESGFWAMPVSGTASAAALTMTGVMVDPVLNRVATDTVRIPRWSATRDADGRLHGTFAFSRETLWGPANVGHRVGDVWTAAYDAELVDVRRVP